MHIFDVKLFGGDVYGFLTLAINIKLPSERISECEGLFSRTMEVELEAIR